METEIRRLRRDIKQIEIELRFVSTVKRSALIEFKSLIDLFSKNHRDIGVKDSKIEELNSVINDQRTTIQALKKQII